MHMGCTPPFSLPYKTHTASTWVEVIKLDRKYVYRKNPETLLPTSLLGVFWVEHQTSIHEVMGSSRIQSKFKSLTLLCLCRTDMHTHAHEHTHAGIPVPERGKCIPASGPRYSKRLPVEDLGNNRRPSPCMSWRRLGGVWRVVRYKWS